MLSGNQESEIPAWRIIGIKNKPCHLNTESFVGEMAAGSGEGKGQESMI